MTCALSPGLTLGDPAGEFIGDLILPCVFDNHSTHPKILGLVDLINDGQSSFVKSASRFSIRPCGSLATELSDISIFLRLLKAGSGESTAMNLGRTSLSLLPFQGEKSSLIQDMHADSTVDRSARA